WLTWRRASAGGLLAFAALGSDTAVYSAMRLLGVGPAGTLIGAGLIHERQPIVLADFVNRARDTTLGPTLTEALRVDLSQSPVVRLAEPSTLSEAYNACNTLRPLPCLRRWRSRSRRARE